MLAAAFRALGKTPPSKAVIETIDQEIKREIRLKLYARMNAEKGGHGNSRDEIGTLIIFLIGFTINQSIGHLKALYENDPNQEKQVILAVNVKLLPEQ